MAKYSEDIKQLAQMCYKRLVMMPYDSHVCTSELLSEIEDDGVVRELPDMFDLHNALMDCIRENRAYEADSTDTAFMCLGLPYNIPFYFRPKVSYRLGWALFQTLMHSGDPQAKEIVAMSDYDYHGYEQPMPLYHVYNMLAKAYRKKCGLKIVADPEFQEGGALHDQYDGWSYHLELDSDKPFPIF